MTLNETVRAMVNDGYKPTESITDRLAKELIESATDHTSPNYKYALSVVLECMNRDRLDDWA